MSEYEAHLGQQIEAARREIEALRSEVSALSFTLIQSIDDTPNMVDFGNPDTSFIPATDIGYAPEGGYPFGDRWNFGIEFIGAANPNSTHPVVRVHPGVWRYRELNVFSDNLPVELEITDKRRTAVLRLLPSEYPELLIEMWDHDITYTGTYLDLDLHYLYDKDGYVTIPLALFTWSSAEIGDATIENARLFKWFLPLVSPTLL